MGNSCKFFTDDGESEVNLIGMPAVPSTLIAEGIPTLTYQEHSVESETESLQMLLLPPSSCELSVGNTPKNPSLFNEHSWNLPTSDLSPKFWKNHGLKIIISDS